MAQKKDYKKENRLVHEEYKQVFDNLPDPIFVTDAQGNVLLSNSTTAMVLGITLDQLLISNVRELVKKEYYNVSYAMQAVEQKAVVSGLLKTRPGFSFISTSTPVFDEKGEVQLVVTSARPKDLIENHAFATRKREIEYLRSRVLGTEDIIAESRAMRLVLLSAHNVAQTDSTVIIHGESGTGKEVLAQYIHLKSKRANEAFIAVNCASFPENLVESELFGYEKGAFTGANPEGKVGLFEAAERGTIFLDEIAELPLHLQAKLLRVLETGEVRRIGSNVDRKINFRLLTATHKDLGKLVIEGKFRQDLYYRLNVYPITIPPLRERPEDISALAAKFLENFNKRYGLNIQLSKENLDDYTKYNWPGNVRELRNVIERMVISNLNNFNSESLDLAFNNPGNRAQRDEWANLFETGGTLREVMKSIEKAYIEHVLTECGGRVCEAANKLGIYRTVLYRKIKEFEKNK